MKKLEETFPYLKTCKEIDSLKLLENTVFVWGKMPLTGAIVIGKRTDWVGVEGYGDLILCSAPTISEMLEIICKSTKVKIGYLPVNGVYNSEKHTMEIVKIPQWIIGPPEEESDPYIAEDTPFLAESVGQFLLQVAYSKTRALEGEKNVKK